MDGDNKIAFTVGVCEALNGGFSFETFMESLGYFYFHWEHSWTNEDYQEWIRLAEDTVTTIHYQNDGECIMKSFPYPKNVNDAFTIFCESFWSFYGDPEQGMDEDETTRILTEYSKLLLTKKHDTNQSY